MSQTAATPITASERIEFLDVLRGVALFGMGLALQIDRATSRGVQLSSFYPRRLLVLAVFGVCNAVLVFFGDILLPYAIAGTVLYLMRERTLRAVARSTCSASPMPNSVENSAMNLFSASIRTSAAVHVSALLSSQTLGSPIASENGSPINGRLTTKMPNSATPRSTSRSSRRSLAVTGVAAGSDMVSVGGARRGEACYRRRTSRALQGDRGGMPARPGLQPAQRREEAVHLGDRRVE